MRFDCKDLGLYFEMNDKNYVAINDETKVKILKMPEAQLKQNLFVFAEVSGQKFTGRMFQMTLDTGRYTTPEEVKRGQDLCRDTVAKFVPGIMLLSEANIMPQNIRNCVWQRANGSIISQYYVAKNGFLICIDGEVKQAHDDLDDLMAAVSMSVNVDNASAFLSEQRQKLMAATADMFNRLQNTSGQGAKIKNDTPKFTQSRAGDMELLATTKDKITRNAAWCASFAAAWKIFQEKYLNNDFSVTTINETITNLKAESEKEININPKDFFATSGQATVKFKKEIEKTLKRKFKTKSDILKHFEFVEDENTLNYLIYAITKFELKFKKSFEDFPNRRPFGAEAKVFAEFFGVPVDTKNDKLKKEVDPIFYENPKSFAVSLNTQDDKSIILYRTDNLDTFENIFNQLKEKRNSNKNKLKVRSFAVPKLHLKLERSFDQLCGVGFVNNLTGVECRILKAMQNLQFDFDRKGARVKSEAALNMLLAASACCPPLVVDFIFDDIFYLFIVEKDTPIVALRVCDIDKFI